MAKELSEFAIDSPEYFGKINAMLANLAALEAKAEEEANAQKVRNAQNLLQYKIDAINKEADFQLRIEDEVNRKLVRANAFLNESEYNEFVARKEKELEKAKELAKEEAAARMTALGASAEDIDAKKEAIEQEYELRKKEEKQAAAEKYKNDLKLRNKLEKEVSKEKKKEEMAQYNAARKSGVDTISSGKLFDKEAWKKATTDENGQFNAGLLADAIGAAVGDMLAKLTKTIDSIGSHKGSIDTRLQGSKNKQNYAGSYWERMSQDITELAAVSPYIKQESVVENLENLVKKGISYNVEQRAFLQTLSEKIATTFNAADGTLLRLIRIQQQDSTAARLGMESALNTFLNNMYETTEYLSDLATNVRSSLEEAQALMGTKQATELEWQLQKWLGSMYSVGMSSKAVQGIADAIGKIAAGDISGITGGGSGNLAIMAANQAGLSIADMLAEGLDASETNRLMQAMVDYLGGIYDNSSSSKVVQQQLASVYGLTASDLKAIKNLTSADTSIISSKNLTFNDMTSQLYNMASTMYKRTSVGEMMTNVWENFKYTMAANIANNPVLYGIYKVAGLLDTVAGGIALPDIKVMGSGVNLQTTVADLMRVASMSAGILTGIGSIANGIGNSFNTKRMLDTIGIGGLSTVSRGSGVTTANSSGYTTSESGYVGNADASAIKDKTLADANADANEQMIQAKEDENNDIERKVVNDSILQIYDLLTEVVDGTKSLNVTSRGRDTLGLSWTK